MTTKRLTAIRATKPASKQRQAPASRFPSQTKRDAVISLLRRPTGATIDDIASATQWQAHSVRGFLSGTIKTKLGLALMTKKVDGATRYRLVKGS